LVLIAFVAFDFAKAPVTRYLEGSKEAIQQDIYMSDGAQLREKYEDATRRIPPAADDADRQRLAKEQKGDFAGAVAGTILMEAKNSAIGSIFLSLLVAVGVASYLMLIWMIFARLRDAEWPNWVGFAILAIPLSQRLFFASMSDMAWNIMLGAFLVALFALAFLPSKSNESKPMLKAAPIPTNSAAGRASFGTKTN
jgi:hypothetical protein